MILKILGVPLPITGQFWAIEVKTEDGDLREAQSDILTLVAASGGLTTVARDCLILRRILNDHLAKYRVSDLSIYMRVITRLKWVYAEHKRLRDAAAKLKRALRRGRR